MDFIVARKILNALPFVLAVLCVGLLHRQLPAAVIALAGARPIALFSVVLFFVWNHFATLSWRVLLRAVGTRQLPVGRLVRLRIEAQAVNQLIPAAGVAGEAMRAISAAGPTEVGAASLATLLDNVAGTLSGIAFAAFAVLLHVNATSGRTELHALVVAAIPAMLLLLVAVVLPFHLAQRWSARSAPAALRRVVDAFTHNRRELRRAFRTAVGFRFLERLVAAGEIYVVFAAVGARISPGDAAFFSAVLILVSFSVFFIPGQLGAAEAAVASACAFVGLPPALGLSAALLRRARQLAVCLLGVALFIARRYGASLAPRPAPATVAAAYPEPPREAPARGAAS